ncbi:MAG: Crp/Fnr family transcriptional regulator [Sphingosinicella sp.]|uniref:Crp/Fnr family transcriptional regulator n=1 Tax=Sphingosinicella sp. TaxID=1917971 RepID=UPI0040379CD8
MLAPALRHDEPLPTGHPCLGCAVRRTAVCGVLGCDELAQMRRLGWTLQLRTGQPLFHEGDAANRVFTLTRGSLKLYRLLPDGRRQVTGFMFPGDFLGIAVDEEHAFTVEALEDSQLCWFPRGRFGEFTEDHPGMERELYRMAAHELAAAQAQMVLLGRKSAGERLASFFLALLGRAERETGSEERFIELPMGRADIADYLGLTKETVSRVLAVLKNQRLVRLAALDRIEVLDRDGLTALAEGMTEH